MSCERQRTCWPLLAEHADSGTCLVENMMDFVANRKRRMIESSATKKASTATKLAKLAEAIASDTVDQWLLTKVKCAKHKKACSTIGPDLVGGGSECTDYSQAGDRAGSYFVEQSKAVLVYRSNITNANAQATLASRFRQLSLLQLFSDGQGKACMRTWDASPQFSSMRAWPSLTRFTSSLSGLAFMASRKS